MKTRFLFVSMALLSGVILHDVQAGKSSEAGAVPTARVCQDGKETVITLNDLKPGESRTFKNASHTLVITRRGDKFEVTVDGKPAGAGAIEINDLKSEKADGDDKVSVRKRVIVLTDGPSDGEKKIVKKVIIRDEDEDDDEDGMAVTVSEEGRDDDDKVVRQKVIVKKGEGESVTVMKDEQHHIVVDGNGSVIIDQKLGDVEKCDAAHKGQLRATITD